MAIFKCKMCGGTLEINNNKSVVECEYCGTQQTVPTTNNEVITNLYNRANNLRLSGEFDKAAQIYEKIVENNDSEAEAHWGIILCKYGIEYVEDPQTMRRIPTCHRTSFDAITQDVDYKAAIDYADSLQQAIYEKEARVIDKIQKDILSIANNEKPFDVFICYKETDESGKRTIDSAIANDIYYQLTEEGFKVFYAPITLEDKLGQEYEPYIFAALNSAKVMLVLGTKPDYLNAVWVKNEWSRFLNFMKTDRSKLLIPCYRDMDVYDLPEEFAHLQAQDMSKIGFINDVVRGIKKVANTDEAKMSVVKEVVVYDENTNIAPLLKRAFMFLEDGDWDSANEYCEKVLDIEPENAEAYLGKLMAEFCIEKQDRLKEQDAPFDSSNNYKKAIRFADEKLKKVLVGYIEHINTRNENARLDSIYTCAKKTMSTAHTEDAYKEAAQLFESVSEYLDSNTLAKECYKNAENERKDAILKRAKSWRTDAVWSCEKAIEMFRSIPGWKDADEQIIACQRKIDEIKAKEENERLEHERKAEIEREEIERIAKRNKKIAIITIPIVCVISVLIIVLNAVIIPNSKYNNAIALMNAERYSDAISVFEALDGYKDSDTKIIECNGNILEKKYKDAMAWIDTGNIVEAYEVLVALEGYKDSTEKANSIYVQYKIEKCKAAKVNDYIIFGTYEQDGNTSNGKEDIEWLVLEVKDGKALLISKYILDCKMFNTSNTDGTWETCSLRMWLNGEFINEAFGVDEKEMIPTVTVSADRNPKYSTNPGNVTQDRVFLLSIAEVGKYFGSDDARMCDPTDVAKWKEFFRYKNNYIWWLRSPGPHQRTATCVCGDGSIDVVGHVVDWNDVGVRPALWINLNP